MLLPLAVVVLLALALLAVLVARRYPVSTWRSGLRGLSEAARDSAADQPVEVVSQDASLEELMTRDGSEVYTGTDSFSGLVDVVEKAMDKAVDTAGTTAAAVRRSRAAKAQAVAGPVAPANRPAGGEPAPSAPGAAYS
ncbi:hypothetical protein [Actinomyces sp.]|uniref:hypothetical protein n=1 Tax=Actinomyces sp. TaxID=29317 RepID=UPI0026DAC60C|nr:hypothetical protein [Actinomyces sp.]